LKQGQNVDFSVFVNKDGITPLLIFPAALFLGEGVYMFVLVKIVQLLDVNISKIIFLAQGSTSLLPCY
jgi:hypothetical protein